MTTSKTMGLWSWSFLIVVYITIIYYCGGHSVTDIVSKRNETALLQELLQLVKNQGVKMKTLERELTSMNDKISQCLCKPRTFPSGSYDGESTPSLLHSRMPGTTKPPFTQERKPTIPEPKSTTEVTSTFDESETTTKEQTQSTQTQTQTTQTAKSGGSRGKEFLFLFMQNLYNKGSLSIHITTEKETNVNLSTSPYLTANIKSAIENVTYFTSHIKINFPYEIRCEYLKVEPKALIIQSSELSTLTLFQRNDYKDSSDGTLIIPTNKLSTKYLISSTDPYRSTVDYYSQFAIGALYEGTSINITLKIKDRSQVTILGKSYGDGDMFQITLNKFETFQVSHTSDLTGTYIASTKPIAVFSGNRCQRFKINYCSHLITQLPTTIELDNEYIVPPFFNNTETLIQIVSESQGNVNLSVGTNSTNLILNGKEGRNIEVASTETTVVVSMTPVLVTGFGMGSKSNDPFMTVIPGIHQYINYYKIMLPDGFSANFICVLIQRSKMNNLQINGQSVDHYHSVYESLVYPKQLHVVRIFEVSNGTYVLTTTDESNFGIIVYGHDRVDGYAFSGNFVFP